jgi:hypothetical protein
VMAYLAKQTFGGTMEHSPSVELMTCPDSSDHG